MSTTLSEIMEMPVMARNFLTNSTGYALPKGVYYLGMGSSYFAPLACKYMGFDLYPEIASEFNNYLKPAEKLESGVLISQSGRSTEVLWCAEYFKKIIAISNDPDSPLCNFPEVETVIPLLAGEEKYSSSKTYVNTLLVLLKGFGIDLNSVVETMEKKFSSYDQKGKELAEEVFQLLQKGKVSGIFIIGNGPNIATAMQAALVMSESTKIGFNGMPMAQYDHGPKETAKDCIVIQIVSKGRSYDRSHQLAQTLKAAGAHVFFVEEPDVSENESVVLNVLPFNFMAYYLSQKLNVGELYAVGGKVTEVNM